MFGKKSAFNIAVDNSNSDITKTFTMKVLEKYDNFIKGNVAYEVPITSEPISNLILKHYWQTSLGTSNCGRNVTKLFDTITSSILTIEQDLDIIGAINVANKIKQAAPNFYGAVAVCKETEEFLNLFHPLTAISIIENLEDLKNKTFTLLIYSFPDNTLKSLSDEYFNHEASIEAMEENIKNIIATYSTKVVAKKYSRIINTVFNDNTISTQINTQTSQTSNQGEAFIIAIQFLTKGIFIPYYGTAIVFWKDSRVYGYHITPFKSCNISNEITEYDSNLRTASVCTGSKSNKTFEGLQTLTHANLSSPYHKDLIGDGALVYAKLCRDKAEQIYILGEVLV